MKKIRFEFHEKIRFELYDKIGFERDEKIRFELNEKKKTWIVWMFWYKMLLMLISRFGFDNKSWTTSVWPIKEANIKGAQLIIRIIFQKWL